MQYVAQGGDIAFFFTAEDARMTFVDGNEGYSLSLAFIDANRDVRITPEAELSGQVNYVLGDDSDRWLSGLPTYSELVYHQLWPGVNLHVPRSEGGL